MIDCSILNRLRGTGIIFTISPLKVNGNILYALYLGVIIGYISQWYYGILTVGLYILGESYGWGKWIGYLTSEGAPKNYNDKEGEQFPFIHFIAETFVEQYTNYTWYCRVALFFRGLFWWMPLYTLFYFIGLINITEMLSLSFLLGIAFPISCEIGKVLNYTGNVWIVHYQKGWENQELVYGLFQGLALWYVLLNGL